MYQIACNPEFQFHKGTIKTQYLLKYRDRTLLFQFHKGTIKTCLTNSGFSRLRIFQFHKGTIKTEISIEYSLTIHISIP